MAKPFAWSFSSLTGFETCAYRYQQINLLKLFKEAKTTELDWGDTVHKTLAGVMLGQLALPDEMKAYAPWVAKVKALPGKLYVEQKYAMDKEFKPTGYFDANVWYRGIGDVVKVIRNRAVIVDWKTGKVKADSVQLMLMAQCIFSHFPEVEEVYTMYIWLKEDAQTVEIYTRQDVADSWLGLFERVQSMEKAVKTNNFPPKPSGLCRKHCPVASCQFYQKGAF
jgi:hypothetical protein